MKRVKLKILCILPAVVYSHDLIQCYTDKDCEGFWPISGVASACDGEGHCTNPFADLGCLASIAEHQDDERHKDIIKARVCNSDDADDDSSLLCRRIKEDIAYGEVRIAIPDWDSGIINSWIYQIILSEVLDVPTTIQTGDTESIAGSFYDRKNRYVYGKESYPFHLLKEAKLLEEKGMACNSRSKNECAHVLPELWDGVLNEAQAAIDEGYIVESRSDGSVGIIGLYVTRFTVENDPSLISYFGMRGESNRNKLAETFKTPTTWGDYCDFISNCTAGDKVAKRMPASELESKSYFDEESYTGYFRQLEENNCIINPHTCGGSFVNAQCGWSTYAEAQMKWQNISLKSTGPLPPNGGYESAHMAQIWNAANATKSNVVMWWWSPSLVKESFSGTESEFQRITFPVPSDECITNRKEWVSMKRCSDDATERLGDAVGSCDYPMISIKKGISKGLELLVDGSTDPLLRSPALDFLLDIQLPAFAIDAILADFAKADFPEKGARAKVCKWVYDNLDSLRNNVPFGYPREFHSNPVERFRMLPEIISIFALFWVFAIALLVMRYGATMQLKLAKIDVLIWVLLGATITIIGSLASAIKTSDITCMLSKWATLFGYTIELVPIIIKVATINRLVREARQLQPFHLKTLHLDLYLIATMLSILIYLIISTIIDPSKVKTESIVYPGENMIRVKGVCASKSYGWSVVDFALQAVILIIASVLVFQSRDVFEKFNEGNGLTLLVFSHTVFLILRILAYQLQSKSLYLFSYESIASMLKSVDIIVAMSFYFGQKLMSILSSNNSIVISPRSDGDSSSASQPTSLEQVEEIARIAHRRDLLSSLRQKKLSNSIQNSIDVPTGSIRFFERSAISEITPCFELEHQSVEEGVPLILDMQPVPEEAPIQGMFETEYYSSGDNESVSSSKSREIPHTSLSTQTKKLSIPNPESESNVFR